MDLKQWLEEDWIQNIYYGDTWLAERMPETDEYKTILEKRESLYHDLVKSNMNLKKELDKYNEYSSQKGAIESEFEFSLGFRTAVCLIMQSIEKK